VSHEWLTDIPFAHRGLHGPLTGHVENSLSAFQAAHDHGHGFELDILLSKDGKAMVFHDVSLERLTGQTGQIQDFTAEQLTQFTLTGSSDTIPTLKELLTVTDQNTPILIEIKGDQGQSDQIAKAVYDDIRDYSGPVAIMSFYPDIIRWFQKHAPHVLRGLVATPLNDGEMPKAFFALASQKSLIVSLTVNFIAYDIKALPNAVTEYCRAENIPVLTWTVRTENLRRKAAQHTDNCIYENLDV
jgi:glycerophosphoryl diester phosphodiesterase